ncbi:hypothetical protein J2TS6_03290 [Paenibacillus albilobatus]|uniref:Uncharacterized protein n=1 Tax=Paenibacillus albilobatus TaxID=2716884 RepID=A0A920C8X0_9BACL|nr:hypothetical protein J2TS6_03290 [Paenibacillus albilobatus]
MNAYGCPAGTGVMTLVWKEVALTAGDIVEAGAAVPLIRIRELTSKETFKLIEYEI